MDPSTIITTFEVASQVVTQAAALVSAVQTAVSSNDPVALQAALAKLQAANDALAAHA